MKSLILLVFCFLIINASAQAVKTHIDSVYYLLDTAKTPINDRMWDVYKKTDYQYYQLRCPCVKNNGMPTFIFNRKEQPIQTLSDVQLKSIRLANLPALITNVKQFLDSNSREKLFFIIEPAGKSYTVHQVVLFNPEIRIVSPPDVVVTPPDNNAFEKNGLMKIAAKDIAKYVNQHVIATGKVIATIVNKNNRLIILYINANYPDQDFTVLISDRNSPKFDTPELYYMSKPIRVVGKVIEYKGKPAIEISEPNQIQVYKEIN